MMRLPGAALSNAMFTTWDVPQAGGGGAGVTE
ncbi:hypothetical protein GA0115246_112123 [Streptomyces sp. SolWspMP-sol7th]|nr:hypothetical protein GA0115246_112123 [Streptomyces sp. SolWspMP-sol7th]